MIRQIIYGGEVKRLIQVHVASVAVIIANLLDQLDQLGSAWERFVCNVNIYVRNTTENRTLEHSNPQFIKIAKIDWIGWTHVERSADQFATEAAVLECRL